MYEMNNISWDGAHLNAPCRREWCPTVRLLAVEAPLAGKSTQLLESLNPALSRLAYLPLVCTYIPSHIMPSYFYYTSPSSSSLSSSYVFVRLGVLLFLHEQSPPLPSPTLFLLIRRHALSIRPERTLYFLESPLVRVCCPRFQEKKDPYERTCPIRFFAIRQWKHPMSPCLTCFPSKRL